MILQYYLQLKKAEEEVNLKFPQFYPTNFAKLTPDYQRPLIIDEDSGDIAPELIIKEIPEKSEPGKNRKAKHVQKRREISVWKERQHFTIPIGIRIIHSRYRQIIFVYSF